MSIENSLLIKAEPSLTQPFFIVDTEGPFGAGSCSDGIDNNC